MIPLISFSWLVGDGGFVDYGERAWAKFCVEMPSPNDWFQAGNFSSLLERPQKPFWIVLIRALSYEHLA